MESSSREVNGKPALAFRTFFDALTEAYRSDVRLGFGGGFADFGDWRLL
jgi:hypothetical protein